MAGQPAIPLSHDQLLAHETSCTELKHESVGCGKVVKCSRLVCVSGEVSNRVECRCMSGYLANAAELMSGAGCREPDIALRSGPAARYTRLMTPRVVWSEWCALRSLWAGAGYEGRGTRRLSKRALKQRQNGKSPFAKRRRGVNLRTCRLKGGC